MSKPVNTTYGYGLRFYEALEKEAEKDTYNGVPMLLFRGKLTQAYKSLQISMSYYSPIVSTLQALSCITIIQRGARSVDTIVALHDRPSETAWEEHSQKPLTKRQDVAILAQMIDNVSKQVGGINVVAALDNLEKRISKLEREARKRNTTNQTDTTTQGDRKVAGAGITVLNNDEITKLLSSSKQRGEYDRQLAAFMESGEPGVQVSLEEGVFAEKKPNSVKTGFESARKREGAPEGAENVRVIVQENAVYLIRQDAA